MPAPDSIIKLVKRFDTNRDAYRSGKYNEAQLRQEFLDPFFEALGWDIYNKKDYAPDYREVISEDSIAIEGQAKAPDYAFRIGGVRKFFVEAKKPSVDIAGDIHPAYQLRRYAWNVHLPLSILTDFEEFAVYDCRNKPDPNDSAATGRTKFFKYSEYVARWDEIASLFSPEAILKGSFDRYVIENKGKKGTTEVDDDFLETIEIWRDLLARNIANRNPQANDEQKLNFAVQMTIDRLIFLRICEDRGIESSEQLLTISKNPAVYSTLLELFSRADTRYNSGLFHFKNEKGQTNDADTFTPSLKIDDKVLKEIIKGMYWPCPYIFKEIPVEILGQVYEQFLGKVIRVTPGGHAKVEEKPEVRKAGGVYYTPTYIVDYIVKNTVGKLLEGKTPVEAASLKIVDPACGSGSFLLGAFQYLLKWHEDWYEKNNPETWAKGKDPALVQVDGGAWKLTLSARKKILVNNIHGVDIDPQAVEVTKLSLLLKVLEEQSGQLSLGFERVLPDLGNNIKCGNSLIGPDYFEGRLVVDKAERRRVNAFDWRTAFPQVFAKDGFDAVIGNPPYIHSREDKFTGIEKKYFQSNFTASDYQVNTYALFMEKAVFLVRNRGLIGQIVPNYWLSTSSDYKLRRLIFFENCVVTILNTYNVFSDASVDTLIYIGEKPELTDSFPKRFTAMSVSRESHTIDERLASIRDANWGFTRKFELSGTEEDISIGFTSEISLRGERSLGEYFDLKFGMKPYQVGKGNPHQSRRVVNLKPFNSMSRVDSSYVPLLGARDVKRYRLNWHGEWLKYGRHLAEPRTFSLFTGERLLIQRIVSGVLLDGTLVSEDFICNTDVITLKLKTSNHNYRIQFFLGLLLSRLVAFQLKAGNVNLDRKTFPKINTKTLNSFPIPSIDFSNPADVARHDRIVALVTRMLDLHKQTPVTPFDQERLARDIAATDAEIDRLVYALYNLTPEEIQIVETA